MTHRRRPGPPAAQVDAGVLEVPDVT